MATTALGRLTLDLAVRMSEFSEGMSRAARETADRTREMSDSVTSFKDNLLESLSGSPIGGAIDSLNSKLSSITTAFGEGGLAGAAKAGALGVIGAVGAMGAGLITLAMQTAEADKELVKLADRAKVSTQQLQVLTAATAKYGIEADGLSDILADVQEKLGEFSATGAGGVVDTLELIEKITGKTASEMEKFGRDLSTKDSVEAIQMVNDILEESGATTQEVRFVTESLASGLGDIIPVWSENGKIIAEYEDILNKAGVIRTKESIEQSAILANQAAATKLQFQGLSNQLVAGTLPALSGLVEYMNSGASSADGLGNKLGFVGIVANSITSFIIGLSTVFVSFGKVIGGVGALLGSFFKMVSGIVANPFSILEQVRNYMNESGAIGGFIIEDLNKELLRGGAAINRTWSPPKAANTVKPVVVAPRSGTAGQYDKSAEAAEKAKEAATKSAKSAKSAKTSEELISKAVVGGKSYPTGDGGHYGANRAGGRKHAGLDLSTPMGTQLYAPEGGKYQFANTPNGTGGRIATLFGDSGKVYRFLHLLNSTIESGSRVEAGAPIAKSGNSGSRSGGKRLGEKGDGYATHLHLEVSQNGKKLNPKGLKIGGSIKYETGVASEYDKIDSAQAQAAKKIADEKARKEEEAKRENERRIEAGNKRVFEGLSEYEQIVKEGEEEQRLATYELSDRKKDLDAELIRINERTNNRLTKLYNDTFSEFMTAEDKLITKRDADIIEIKSKYAEGDPIRDQAIKATLENFEKDWKDLSWAAGEEARKRQDLTDKISTSIGTSTNEALMRSMDSQARLNLSPKEYEGYNRQQTKANDYGLLEAGRINRESEIYETDEKGNYTKDQDQINQLLLESHEEYLAKKQALDDEYAVRDKELTQETARAKLDIEQANVDAFGSLAGALFGQQSSAAKAAFLLSKAYTVQKILLDKGAAMSSAYADAKGGVFAKAAAAAKAGLENGLISDMVNQVVMPSFTGIAHGGMDFIPSESTFLLDKGERVLSPRQNKDLTNFLASGGSKASGETNITINIDNNGNANMSNDNAAEVSKQMSLQIKNIVEATLRKEKRQGGML